MLSYNSGAFLPVSISAVLSQKAAFDIQLVISDDCSTDKATIDICHKYAEAFPDKVTLITHDANQGIPRNFLDALSACKGEYIAMCDADDYWCCDIKLQTMVEYMDHHPDCTLSFHRVINYYEDSGTKSLSNGAQRRVDYTLSDLCAGNFITNCSVLYRKSAITDVPDTVGEILLCDYAMHLLFATKGTIHFFPKPMAVYRKRSDALWTGVKATQRYRDALRVREFGLKLLESAKLDDNYNIMAENYTSNAISCLAAAQVEGIEMTDIEQKLLSLHPYWTKDEIARKVKAKLNSAHKKGLSEKVAQMASALRSLISRIVPLPKVKPLIP